MPNRMTHEQARYILAECQCLDRALYPHNFYTLTSRTIENLLDHASINNYRKPKLANGSRARYFYSYLCAVYAKRD